ncbi:unnamed protein product [Onchocerca flexuosa]|uniref:DUF3563 domain-containing protein n=1 Tax=Onchocerca flexuosa TaxID=387005 RepID=A0A183HU71_9BILA|nr:unnamed protein product [Onchocerca flexuosa]
MLEHFARKTFFSEVQQLRKVLGMFDKDYQQGNMTRFESDFKTALNEYGDGRQR